MSKYKLSKEYTQYDKKEAESYIGKIIENSWGKMEISEIVNHHYFMITETGNPQITPVKDFLEERIEEKKEKEIHENVLKVFDGHILRDKKGGRHGGNEYYFGINPYREYGSLAHADTRFVSVDFYNGRFGTMTGGYSPTGTTMKRFPDEKQFERIPLGKAEDRIFSDFKKSFDKELKLEKEVYLQVGEPGYMEQINMMIWNSGGNFVYHFTGFFTEKDWGKDYFIMDSLRVIDHPKDGKSGRATTGGRLGSKKAYGKNANLVSKEEALKPIYDYMKTKIKEMVSAKKDYEGLF